MRRILFLAALTTLSVSVSAHDAAGTATVQSALPSSARGAAATVDAFHAALRRGDTKAAAALLAEDALIFEEGGAERSKAGYTARHLPADAAFSQVVATTVIRRTGGSDRSFAWVATEGRMTGNWQGRAVDRLTTETMLLSRVGRVWRITHIHWSSAPAR
jgi:ketosteroid isomerase-like protein